MKYVALTSALLAAIPFAFGNEPAGAYDPAQETGSEFSSLDANGDLYISQDEAAGSEIAEQFSSADTNMDGQLSEEEYNNLVKNATEDAESDLDMGS